MRSQLPAVRGSGCNIGSLFIVAGVAYLLGVLTTPALPPLPTFKASQAVLTAIPQSTKPQPVGQTSGCETKQISLPGYELLPTDLVTFYTSCKAEIPPGSIREFLIKKLFDGVSPFEEFPPKHVAPLLHHENIRGWGSKTKVFWRLMEEVRPRVVIELGTFLGASATHLGHLAKELELNTDILCVDDFRGWPGFREPPFEDIKQQNGDAMLMYQFMQNVVNKNLSRNILPVPFATVSALGSFCQWGIYADLIEVDASHDFHSAWADINIAHPLLRPGGVMFGHDYLTGADRHGVRRAVDMFAQVKNLTVEPDGQHWILRRKSS